MTAIEGLSHLSAAAAEIVDRSNGERTRAIWSTRWVDYPRATHLLAVLNNLLDRPRATRMPSLAIYADSGMGKTMLMKHFLARHQTQFDRAALADRAPVVALQMASKPNERRFYSQLLDTVGAPPSPRMALADLEIVTLRVLRQIRAKMLLIDEAHNILAASFSDQRAMLNLIRFLSNELEMSVVCFGVSDAREAISGDVQLARRFQEYSLPRWQADEEFQNLAINVLRSFPLRKPSVLSPRALKLLLQLSDGVTANIVEVLQEAAVAAIRSGQEFVNDELLEAVDLPHVASQRFA
jgi:hypothetical protein